MEERLEIVLKCVISDLRKQLPVLDFIIANNSGYLFGGVIREIIYNYMWYPNNRKKVVENVIKYVSRADIDIHLRWDTWLGWDCDPFAVFEKVFALNGYVEYMGDSYDFHGEYNMHSHDFGNIMDVEPDRVTSGVYRMWVPSKTTQYIIYDVMVVYQAAHEIKDDLSVNKGFLSFHMGNPFEFYIDEIDIHCIQHRVLIPRGNWICNEYKKFYRLKYFIEKGYVSFLELSWWKSFIRPERSYNRFVWKGNMRLPSVPSSDKKVVYTAFSFDVLSEMPVFEFKPVSYIQYMRMNLNWFKSLRDMAKYAWFYFTICKNGYTG